MNRLLGPALALALAATGACAAPAPPAAAKPPETVCPEGSGWNGRQCVRTLVVNEVTCPPGSSWDGARCAGTLVVDCPAGTRFVDGTGCVAELVFDAHPPPADPLASGLTAAIAPAGGTAAPPAAGVVDPWTKGKPGGTAKAIPPAKPKPACGCAASDLMCLMKCSATCKDPTGKACQGQAAQTPPSNTGREFDRGAAATTLAAASNAARSCTGNSGSTRVRVVFAPTGKVTSASVDGPFAGTPQGGCIAAAFRNAQIPPFDGSPVAVSKAVDIP
jgi:hypothetical protein